ncbi:MAG: sensor histidine kinase [Deltaproteobacteria bacterium]|nr:sensor histidine kinase [Deltaproteobacteria bacterium]
MDSANRSFRDLLGARMWVLSYGPILLVTALHFATPTHAHGAHDILRRLYYLPILLGAFAGGWRGGLAASLVTALCYIPHGFLAIGMHDPGRPVEKVLELVLYQVVAVVAGVLVDREREERRRQERLALRLQATLDELRATERQLVRSQSLAALGQMTSGLAHEIRNPLHAMKGTAEVLGDFLPDDPRPRRMLELQVREIDRLAALLERFLAFARPRAPEKKAHLAGDLVRRAAELLRVEAARAGVDVDVRVAADDPAVGCDAAQIEQVILNVGLNAIQAMAPAKRGTLRLATSRLRRGEVEYGAIRVANDGPPIPQDLRDRLFEPFVTSRENGTGLGLAIAERIVDAHGGLLEVEPGGEGREVAFVIHLPQG